MGVLWRYGVQHLTYHDIVPEITVSQIIMNIRNPFSRIRSWLRLWNTTLPSPISAKDFIENLHTGEHGVSWVNIIDVPNGVRHPWKYVVPLHYYTDQLALHGKAVNHFIRQEHLEEDMEAAGYPTMGYDYDHTIINPPTDEKSIVQFMKNQPVAGEIEIGFRVKQPGQKWEAGDGTPDKDFYFANPHCADIIATYYRKDFETFGYSFNIEDI